jgi:hypothetical protein
MKKIVFTIFVSVLCSIIFSQLTFSQMGAHSVMHTGRVGVGVGVGVGHNIGRFPPPVPPPIPVKVPKQRVDAKQRVEDYYSQPCQSRLIQYIVQSVQAVVQTRSVSEPQLTSPQNSTTNVPKIPKDVVGKNKNLVNKEIFAALESLVESLEDAIMTREKMNTIAQKFIDEGKDKKKVDNFLNAINNGDVATAGKLLSEMSDNNFEGIKIVNEINLGKQISDFDESVASYD